MANEVANVAAAAQNATKVDVSLSYGTSKSESKQTSTSDTARGSTVKAGGNVNIAATGGGENSNLTVQGSDISGQQISLAADNQVAFLAASNSSTQTSTSSNSSSSVGASVGTSGLGVTASAALGKGNGNGTDTTYTNTHIAGAESVTIKSGGDTTLKGATVEGKQVTATVGGNLNIESLQDTRTYAEKNQQVGGSVMVGVTQTGLASGNVNLAKSNIDSNYASVSEQSAIKAGNSGFAVNVQGNTDLKGGAITSTQAAIDQNKNSFQTGGTLTTSDLQNSAIYNAKSVSVTVGMGSVPGQSASAGMSGVGFGTDKGSANSTTTAGISGVAGDSSKRTGDKEQGIAQIFNKDQVKAEINAQTQITQEFGKNASKAVGDYAQTKLDEAKKNNDQAGIEAWKEGGTSRVALHTLVGGLTGGVQGAVGAGTSQAAIDQIGQAIKDTNLPTELKQALVAVAGTAIGAATGGTAGAATGLNATVNNYLTQAQLQSKQQQLAACKDDACKKEVSTTWEKVSQAANVRVEDKALQANVSDNLKAMNQLSSDMSGLAQYKTGLEDQLRSTSDPTQRASLQLQINEADNNMRQIAGEGKTITALLYQQTGEARYQNAFQALSAATSGNELGAALAMPGGSGGNVNKAVQETKPGVNVAEQAAIAKAKVDNNFYSEGASSNPVGLTTSAGVIPANPDKTTTVLGRYSPDMSSVIGEQTKAVKTEDFGARPGGFNVLNVDDVKAAASPNFFEQYNKPFLDQALKRGDDVALGTIPVVKKDVFDLETGQLKGNFAKELDYLVRNNYKPVNVSPSQWETIKGWFK